MSEIDCAHWIPAMLKAEQRENNRLRLQLQQEISKYQNAISSIRAIINGVDRFPESFQEALQNSAFIQQRAQAQYSAISGRQSILGNLLGNILS